jgi:hypothetical protein
MSPEPARELTYSSAPPLLDTAVLAASDEKPCPNCGQAIKTAALACRHCGSTVDPSLAAQERIAAAEQLSRTQMRNYVRQSGIGWLFVAAIQFVFSGFLSMEWGIVCLVLGLLSIALPYRGMLVLNGLAMMGIGVVNATGQGGMQIFGVMQVFWGFKELRRFATGDVTKK